MATGGLPLWSTTAASNATADPAVNWAEGMAPSAVNDSARAQMASVAKWRDDLYGVTSGLTTGGTTTAFTVTTNSTYATAAVMSGAIFTIVMNATSGAAPTLAVDGLTARALNVSTGVAVPTGALISGTPYMVRYVHATTEFIVLNPSIGPVSSVDIIGATQLTAPANNDTLPIYDLSATANKRILVSDFLTVINDLTADSSPDQTADYVVTYDASAAASKKVLLNKISGRAFPVPAVYKNLSIKVASNTTVAVAADFVTTTDASAYQTTAVSSTINLATTGADALDTGTIAIDSWYFIWVIAKSDGTTKCVASLQSTANGTFTAALPSGYTYYARIGAVKTAHGSATLFGTWQLGNVASYIVGLAQTANLPIVQSGTTGSVSVPTWASLTVNGGNVQASYVPSTAGRILGTLISGISANAISMAAPNGSYGAATSLTNPAPIQAGSSSARQNLPFDFLLESSAIFMATDSNGTPLLVCRGWVDNI